MSYINEVINSATARRTDDEKWNMKQKLITLL